jgi:uncharacterized membrane-anchored protein YitT (DUF2179 family)
MKTRVLSWLNRLEMPVTIILVYIAAVLFVLAYVWIILFSFYSFFFPPSILGLDDLQVTTGVIDTVERTGGKSTSTEITLRGNDTKIRPMFSWEPDLHAALIERKGRKVTIWSESGNYIDEKIASIYQICTGNYCLIRYNETAQYLKNNSKWGLLVGVVMLLLPLGLHLADKMSAILPRRRGYR